jgi:manganese/zinc/iron transport system permease protein
MNGVAHVLGAINFASYNTRVVLAGASLLGLAAGVIGTFLLLRRKALIGDVVGHCALPGIAVAFLVIERMSPGAGKNLPALLLGATCAGLLGAQSVSLIRMFTRVDSDTALAVVLSVFYGAGVALLSVVQKLASGSSAGLKDFLNGQTAAIVSQDVWIFTVSSVVIMVVTAVLFKEFTLLCFDEDYAATRGLPTRMLDIGLTLLATAVSVVGMQTVGLLLVTAILVTPPAAARFWTNDIRVMAVLAGLIGALSAAAGVIASAARSHLPAGPMIVLSGGVIFIVSLAFGRERGVVWKWLVHRQDQQRADRIDLLRSLYESVEADPAASTHAANSVIRAVVPVEKIKPLRTWSSRRLNRALGACVREGILSRTEKGGIAITQSAWNEGSQIVRNRRLWDLYLQQNADVSPAGIDRNQSLLDQALDPVLVAKLEEALKSSPPNAGH